MCARPSMYVNGLRRNLKQPSKTASLPGGNRQTSIHLSHRQFLTPVFERTCETRFVHAKQEINICMERETERKRERERGLLFKTASQRKVTGHRVFPDECEVSWKCEKKGEKKQMCFGGGLGAVYNINRRRFEKRLPPAVQFD